MWSLSCEKREAKTADFLQDVFVNNNDVAPMHWLPSRVILGLINSTISCCLMELHAQSFIYRSCDRLIATGADCPFGSYLVSTGGVQFPTRRDRVGDGVDGISITLPEFKHPLESMQFHANNVQYLKGAFANLAELERKFVMQSGNSPYLLNLIRLLFGSIFQTWEILITRY